MEGNPVNTSRKKRSGSRAFITGKRANKDIEELSKFSQTQVVDPFTDIYLDSAGEKPENEETLSILEPPYSLPRLMKLPYLNNTLLQCITAMTLNIEGYGYRLEYVGEEGGQESDAAIAEHDSLVEKLDYPNPDYSMTELRKKVRLDVETIGYGFIEVVRDQKDEISGFYHAPGDTIRKTVKSKHPTEITQYIPRGGDFVPVKRVKFFRRYVQSVNGNKIYFKEFGDPAIIDAKTGKVVDETDNPATEIIELSINAMGSAYGVPRWINQLPSIIGSRECELTNMDFFNENAIPAMAVLVSGGALSETSIEKLETSFNKHRGRDAANRVMVLEAYGDESAADDKGRIPPPKLEMKPLTSERQSDALFKEYDAECINKVRSSFRLPPIYIGRSEDYTHATAKESSLIAEMQVFQPERKYVDQIINLRLLQDKDGKPPRHWRVRSQPPKITSSSEIIEAISTLEQSGALTPNVVIGMANEMFDLQIKTIKDDWGDMPYSLIKDLITSGTFEIDGLNRVEPPKEPIGVS